MISTTHASTISTHPAILPRTTAPRRDVVLWFAPILVLAYCGAFFFYGVSRGELYRNETLRAILGAEVLRTGNWVVPMLYGEPLLTKPPLMYAAIAGTSAPFGRVTETTSRIPSAVAATVLSLLLYFWASRQLGRLGGLVLALVTPSAYLWLEKASTAEIDMLLVMWVGAAVICCFRAVESNDSVECYGASRSRASRFAFVWWQAALLCVAAGVLTKWTAFVYFYATAIPYLVWRGRVRLLWSPEHVVAALVGAGLCAAWLAAVVQQVGWETCKQQILAEALPRVLHDRNLTEHQLGETLVHPFKVWAINLPWSAFALLALHSAFLRCWDERGRRLVQILHCWAWPNLVVFTLLPDHATRHSFPYCPAITALGAMVWLAAITGRLPTSLMMWHRRLAWTTVAILATGFLGAGVVSVAELPSAVWWLILVLTMVALWCMREGWVAWREARWGRVLTALMFAWLVVKLTYVEIYIPVRDARRQPRAKAAQLGRHIPAGQVLYLKGVKDEGILFYYGRPAVRLRDWDRLPAGGTPAYCILTTMEWQALRGSDRWQAVLEVPLRDTQGDDLVLVALVPNTRPAERAA